MQITNHHKAGIVIILHGPSASGKTSIQKAFQTLMMPELWIKLGVDSLFDAPMPDITPATMHLWAPGNSMRWVETSYDQQGNANIALHVGREGQRVAYGMNSAIAAYAKNGCNCIVDYIAYDSAWLTDLAKKLDGIQTYWIKVTTPLDVLEQREVARGTSPKGHARSHYTSVYGSITYDLEIRTDLYCAQECAQQIKNLILRI